MSDKVKYVSISPAIWDQCQEKDNYEEKITTLALAVKKEIEENAGFLKLVYQETGEAIYYNRKVCGIFGDLSKTQSFLLGEYKISFAQELLNRIKKDPCTTICHLPARILDNKNYQVLFLDGEYEKRWEKRGWLNVQDMSVMVLEPMSVFGSENQTVCLIPVFCCKENGWKITSDSTEHDLIVQLVLQGMMPAVASEIDDISWKELRLHIERYYSDLGGEKKRTDITVVQADEKTLKRIKEYYSKRDFWTAALPVYGDNIFDRSKGCWDLYPFVGLKEEQLKSVDGWYEVTGLYAKNPLEDVASATEQVAIDFGTKSTTVAVYDKKGNITMIPVGNMDEAGETAFENPTILEFRDIKKFMTDYRKVEYRPDTKFSDISVSHAALADYENRNDQKDNIIYQDQYLNHLKQWINNPNSTLEAVDSKGEEILLEHDKFNPLEETLNPIEIYAYYIGRNINNMHYGKIYLKYLLSYSATYTEKSREWIRASFEKGLKKSLPPQVGNNKEVMKKFEVKLWRDEATAYAVSAVSKYLAEDCSDDREEESTKKELEEDGIFYGIYDFGGGTLDFSFGIMRQEGEKDVYRQLKRGGSPNLGCENILEALAFEIFCKEENRNRLREEKIKCQKPFLYGVQQNEYQIVGHSSAARYNTCSMIAYLREFWINGTKETAVRLRNERGEERQAELKEKITTGNNKGNNGIIELKMGDEEIEKAFRENVTLGVCLFLQYYKEVIKNKKELEKKKCFIYLAGNASRAKRVEECFHKELEKENLTESFCIKKPLPTKSDEDWHKNHTEKSIPTAKSGVVFGMLYSGPYVEDIEVIDEMPQVNFLYHIGKKKKDRTNDRGLFQLLMHANQVPTENKEYRYLMPITQPYFNLLYTNDGGYALETFRRSIGYEVNVMAIQVPETYVGYSLYVRAVPDSIDSLELGVSKENSEYQDKVERVGICNFTKGEFEMTDSESKCPEVKTELLHSDYDISIKDKKILQFKRRISEGDEIKPELLFETDSDYLEFLYKDSGQTEEIPYSIIKIELGNLGIQKKIYLMKRKKDGTKIGLACDMAGKKVIFTVDMLQKSVKVEK